MTDTLACTTRMPVSAGPPGKIIPSRDVPASCLRARSRRLFDNSNGISIRARAVRASTIVSTGRRTAAFESAASAAATVIAMCARHTSKACGARPDDECVTASRMGAAALWNPTHLDHHLRAEVPPRI